MHQTKMAHATSQADLTTLQATHSQSRGDIEKLQKENGMLEDRARDAENKVQLLLDQVEHSVDNYRRQSKLGESVPTMNGLLHPRSPSSMSEANTNHVGGHSRNLSDGANSTISDATGADARNSMALDSLASELDALRSHWETTVNYRLSDRFDFERTPTATNQHASGDFGSLANWRRGLDVSDEEDRSRPTTSDGADTDTVRGEDDESPNDSVDHGMAVTTPSGML